MVEPVFSLALAIHELPTAKATLKRFAHKQTFIIKVLSTVWAKPKQRLKASPSVVPLPTYAAAPVGIFKESQFIRLEGMDYLWHLATEYQAFHPAVPDVITWSFGGWGGLGKRFETLSILILNDYWWVIMSSGQFLTLLCHCRNIVSLTAGFLLGWIPVTIFIVQTRRASKQSKQDVFSKALRKSP